MVEMMLMDEEGEVIEGVSPTFLLVRIRKEGLGPQMLGPGWPSCTDQPE